MNRILLFLLLMGTSSCMDNGYKRALSDKEYEARQTVATILIQKAQEYQDSRYSLQKQIEQAKKQNKSRERKETLKMLKEELNKQEDFFVGKLAFYAPFEPSLQSPQQWYNSLDWNARRFIAQQLKIEQKIIDDLPQENGCTIL